MADNLAITAGSGTTIAADDIAGVYYQRVKVTHGADGASTDVSTASPLPVSDAGGSITVDGSVTVSSLPALAAGTNNIGDVDVLTLPALAAGSNNIGDVDVLTLPALPTGSNTIGTVSLTDISAGEYETVAASATDQALGATGASGDYLSGVLIVPATTSPGAVSIKDGAGSAITVFTGGASSVSNLVPFFVPLGIKSGAGAWKVTTGTNVSAIGVGNFT